jgi:hypothetical protein
MNDQANLNHIISFEKESEIRQLALNQLNHN